MARPRGISDDEMFLSKPADDCDSPTIEPLRIFKPQSPGPASSERPQGRFQYPAPGQPKPSFPLPPGASSSAEPLPYPDEDHDFRPSQPPASNLPALATWAGLAGGGGYSPLGLGRGGLLFGWDTG